MEVHVRGVEGATQRLPVAFPRSATGAIGAAIQWAQESEDGLPWVVVRGSRSEAVVIDARLGRAYVQNEQLLAAVQEFFDDVHIEATPAAGPTRRPEWCPRYPLRY